MVNTFIAPKIAGRHILTAHFLRVLDQHKQLHHSFICFKLDSEIVNDCKLWQTFNVGVERVKHFNNQTLEPLKTLSTTTNAKVPTATAIVVMMEMMLIALCVFFLQKNTCAQKQWQ